MLKRSGDAVGSQWDRSGIALRTWGLDGQIPAIGPNEQLIWHGNRANSFFWSIFSSRLRGSINVFGQFRRKL